jgi:NADPH-dependent glutamate synthase beta subunit-like oxidoreductase
VGPFAAGTEEAVLACHAACPAGVDVPAYVALMAEGRFAEAAAVVRNRAPLPLVLGHACYRPCEDDCRRGRLSDPVAVCDLKRVAGEADPIHPAPLPPTGRKVAVVGSGPAGLSAAHYLAALGHAVTVFESDPEPGGLLRYGIPEERLPRAAVDREVRDLADRGIEFRTGVRLGDGLAPADLEHEFDAAVLATGAGPGKRLDLPGADLEGIGTALDFLRSAARGAPNPDVTGRRVVVIGGGGVAMDAASTAARSGAEAVDVFCLESRAEMPAHPSEIGLALSLGVRLHPGWGPTGYSEKGPRVGAVELVRCLSVFDDRGRFAPRLDPATSGRAPADLVLLAVGQEPDPAIRNAEPTGIPVASAGDLVTGPANLARAVASGREAALLVHRELGLSGTPPEFVPDPPPAARLVPIEDFASLPRRPLPLDAATAAAEADRCLRCDLRFTVSLPPAPPAPHHRLGPEEIARVPAEPGVLTFFDAGLRTLFIQGVPDLRAGAAAAPDDASFFTFELSEMYTQRESELNSKLLASGAAPLVDDDLF